MPRARKAADFDRAIGYKLRSRVLREQALTHASARVVRSAASDNERLEFIGDRVLGLAVAEMLAEALPSAREGELARRYNQLVNGTTCARVARRIDLGQHLILSASEEESGGRTKETILADAMEALLAAIFIEAGYDAARTVIRRMWASEIEGLPEQMADAKSALQEWAQAQGLALPAYVEIERSGPDHAPRFVAEVRIKGVRAARGEGASKRAAEQAAASAMLAREGVWKGPGHG